MRKLITPGMSYWLYVLSLPIDTDNVGKLVLREEVTEIRDVIKQIRNRLNIAVFDEVKLCGEKIGKYSYLS
jgi:hypothetical protein